MTKWFWDSHYEQYVDQIKVSPRVDIDRLTEIATNDLLVSMKERDPNAITFAEPLIRAGVRSHFKGLKRNADKVRVILPPTDATEKPVKSRGGLVYTSPQVDKNLVVTGTDYVAVWDMTKQEFKALLVGMTAKSVNLSNAVRILLKINSVWEKYPRAKSAREAYRMAGLPLDEIDISDVEGLG
jgi:hypothetical protein